MTNKNPYISVIIPAYNSTKYIAPCLEALSKSTYTSYEVILVDDGSDDDTAQIAREMGSIVLKLDSQSGPAGARNHGSEHAKGDILLFIDSDVLVKRDTLELIASTFIDNPGISAVFGSYDDAPEAPDFISQYRNLLHHYVHQRANRDAKTFWTGCGAIRKEIFDDLGGFDEVRHPVPSMEDIEIGLRMSSTGYKIILDKNIQVKHLKHWGLYSLIWTDIFHRAVPWSKLIIERNILPRDLNLRFTDRISTALVGLLLICLLFLFLDVINLYNPLSSGFLLSISAIIILALVVLNRNLYGFFLEKRGIKFTLLVIPLHFLYYFYCGASFGVCWIQNKLGLLKTSETNS